MKITFNFDQRKSLSSFFNSIAVAWFVALFIPPTITPYFNPLITVTQFVNMLGALYLSLFIIEKEKNEP